MYICVHAVSIFHSGFDCVICSFRCHLFVIGFTCLAFMIFTFLFCLTILSYDMILWQRRNDRKMKARERKMRDFLFKLFVIVSIKFHHTSMIWTRTTIKSLKQSIKMQPQTKVKHSCQMTHNCANLCLTKMCVYIYICIILGHRQKCGLA